MALKGGKSGTVSKPYEHNSRLAGKSQRINTDKNKTDPGKN